MQERFQYTKAYPDAYKAMMELSQAVEKTGLASQLIDLVDYRVSQINGCAFCLDMHSKKTYALAGKYTKQERAALAWAAAVTKLDNQQVSDTVFEMASQEFSEAKLILLTLAIRCGLASPKSSASGIRFCSRQWAALLAAVWRAR